MSYERKPGTGVLFSEGNKAHEKAPDYKGNLLLDRDYKAGEEIKLAGWAKTSGRGPLVSLSIDNFKPQPRQAGSGQYPREAENSRANSGGFPGPRRGPSIREDDIPF
jgi:hypothetical protein